MDGKYAIILRLFDGKMERKSHCNNFVTNIAKMGKNMLK